VCASVTQHLPPPCTPMFMLPCLFSAAITSGGGLFLLIQATNKAIDMLAIDMSFYCITWLEGVNNSFPAERS
jgi:hypothetical protein